MGVVTLAGGGGCGVGSTALVGFVVSFWCEACEVTASDTYNIRHHSNMCTYKKFNFRKLKELFFRSCDLIGDTVP